MASLPAARARRIALAAQGLARPRPSRATAAQMRRVIGALGVLQIDSVNVLARAHFMPLFSRLGPYPVDRLERMAYRDHELFEYWGHQASLMPIDLYRPMRWRMQTVADGLLWKGFARWAEANRPAVDAVEAEIAARGPLGVSDLAAPGRRSGPWWGWSEGKTALEWLYSAGRVVVAGRRNFERLYDLPERVLPADLLAGPPPPQDDAVEALVRRGAHALGIGTAADIADYYQVKTSLARPVLERLARDGVLERVTVEGWRDPAYLDPAVRVPRALRARAFVSPFDPLMFTRKRMTRLFGFDYTIEIYVPAPKRRYGYYVLPFLFGDRLAARADLKADRAAGVLRAPAIFAEDDVDSAEVAAAIADELRVLASWQGLGDVAVGRRGDLANAVRRALG